MKIKNYAQGGVVEGPSHAQGGVPAVDQSGQQIAEVEGNERIFSVEDTQKIEEMAMAIQELPTQEADRAAMELGYSIVSMVGQQDVAQAEQEVAVAENQQTTPEPYEETFNEAPV